MNATTNGRARKSLADQIDRLDTVLDGLADGLNDAIASAVQQAVQAVLTEVLSRPEVVARLSPPSADPKPTRTAAIAAAARRAWLWVREKCGMARKAITICTKPITRAANTIRVNAARLTANVGSRLLGAALWTFAGMGWLRGLATSRMVVFALGFGLGIVAGWSAPAWTALVGTAMVGIWGWQRQPFLGPPV